MKKKLENVAWSFRWLTIHLTLIKNRRKIYSSIAASLEVKNDICYMYAQIVHIDISEHEAINHVAMVCIGQLWKGEDLL